MPRIFRSSSATVGFVGAAILAAFAVAAFTGTQAMAQYYSRALNPQPLPPGRALNPQPLPPGIYAPGHRQPNIACRRVCAQSR